MTKREIFNKVKTHLLTQNARSTTKPLNLQAGHCRYRYNDLMCAAGCLIADENYSDNLEGHNVNTDGCVLRAIENSLGGKISYETVDMIRQLQTIHDTKEPAEWPQLLDEKEWTLD